MKFLLDNAVFDDKLEWLKEYFEKFTHCERAIAVCTLLKQFQHPTLRFIQSKIEATYAQSTESDKNKWMEQKSNDKSYISDLCDSYKSLTNTTNDVQSNNNNKDSNYFESDRIIVGDQKSTNFIISNTINNNNNNNYSNINANSTSIKGNIVTDKCSTKEDILVEILNCILMLRIGNDDVIQEYLALIPFMVDDTHRRIINVEVVMQTLSILVAHPALSSDDLRTVKEHIERLKDIIHGQNNQHSIDWQTIVPPFNSYRTRTSNIFSSHSSVGSSQVQNENHYDTQNDYIETESSKTNRSSGGGNDFISPNIRLSCKQCHNNINDDLYSNGFHNPSDDPNISFSKNGIEIPDFDTEPEPSSNHPKTKNLTLTPLNPLIDNFVMKTRRSSSLTTGGIKHNDQNRDETFTTSTENLAFLNKQRSYSLSIENPRLVMTASGSETRLDMLKPAHQGLQSHKPGMHYVGVWLKKLRLHKYEYIFQNFTFEDMMNITVEYLERSEVTQGARTKLVNSIQKLKERYNQLAQAEQDVENDKISLEKAILLLIEIVETPMKPIDMYDKNHVASQFLSLLNTVWEKMKLICPLEEDQVNKMSSICDILINKNTEPFHSCIDELLRLRSEMNSIRTTKFQSKSCGNSKCGNGSAYTNSNKPRWTSSSKLQNKNGCESKPQRKNSNHMPNISFISIPMQKHQKPTHLSSKTKQTQQRVSRQSEFSNNFNSTSCYSKSSSYPNFSSNSNNNNSNGNGQSYASANNQNVNTQLHHSYHRHSVSNLITIATANTTATVTPTTPITEHQKTSNCVCSHFSPQSTAHLTTSSSSNAAATPITSSAIIPSISYSWPQFSTEQLTPENIGRSSSTDNSSYLTQTSNKNLLGEINSYRELECLSLNMTEQVING